MKNEAIFTAESEDALEQWRQKLAEAEEVMKQMEAMITATEDENKRLQVSIILFITVYVIETGVAVTV